MDITRRDACVLTAAAAAALTLPSGLAHAQEAQEPGALDAAIDDFTGGAKLGEGGVEITAPEIAENGNTVPIEIDAGEDVTRVIVLADGNPNPGLATFHFSELSGERRASTRIRLAQTQNVIAVAEKADGSFVKASRAVKVTIGGCGG